MFEGKRVGCVWQSKNQQKQHYSIAEELTWEDEACDALGLVEKTGEGYRLCMEVPSLLYKFIIGKRGETKRKIEKETGTQIMIPRQGEEGDVGESYSRADAGMT